MTTGARRYAITGPSGTRCGVYPGPAPLAAMAFAAGFADLAEWSAATGVAPERMRLAPVPERGELCLLPGGLLGRVVSAPCPRGTVSVERWALLDWPTASAQPYGWSGFGTMPECRLTTEGVEGHHHYSAARAAAPIV